MRSINRQYYRILFITIRTATRVIKLACYCRYATNAKLAYRAVVKCIARHGYAGAVGRVSVTRQLASRIAAVDSFLQCGAMGRAYTGRLVG